MTSHGTEAITGDTQRPTCALAAITGPSGFIGSHVTAHLAEMGYRVRALVHRHPLEPTVACHVDGVVHGSLSDSHSLAELVRGAQVVVHIGGLIRGSPRRTVFAVNPESTRPFSHPLIRASPAPP